MTKRAVDEVYAGLIIVAIATIIWFLPNHTIDSWDLINPKRLGMVILLIASIQFGGYLAIRWFGDKYGLAFSGFFGGLVSSTAVFLNIPKIYHERRHLLYPVVSSAILATIGMLVEFYAIVYTVSKSLSQLVFFPIITMVLVGGFCAFLVFRQDGNNHQHIQQPYKPLDLYSVFKLASLSIGALILIAAVTKHLGIPSAEYTTFFAALFELHSVTLATSTLYMEHQISLKTAKDLLLLALSATFLSKFLLILFFSRSKLTLWIATFLGLMFISGMLAFKFF